MFHKVKNRYVNPLLKLVRSHPISNPQQRWNAQYEKQEWSYLGGLQEFAHYAVVAGYAAHLNPAGSVLDLGCGEGLLAPYLCLSGREAYLGVDVSDAAVRLATQKQIPHAAFLAANITEYEPDRMYDFIIICEALQYIYKPSQLLRRYTPYLRPGGYFILSLFEDGHHGTWEELAGNYPPAFDETRVVNTKGMTWIVKVMPPAGAPGGSLK